MKKVLVVFAFVFFMVVLPVLSQDFDLSSLDYEELSDLKKQVDYEIMSRPEHGYFRLEIGEYVAGTDIPAGDYLFYMGDLKEDATDIIISDTNGEETEIWIHRPEDAKNGDQKYKIREGYKILIKRGPAIFSRDMLDLEELFDPEIAEGTFIPVGKYTIGEEIPSGIFLVYPSQIHYSHITVYKDDEACQNGKYDLYATLDYSYDSYEKAVKLSDGNIFRVEKYPVIMKKVASSFSFD